MDCVRTVLRMGVRAIGHDLSPLDPGNPGRRAGARRSRDRRRRDHVHGLAHPRRRRRQRQGHRHRVDPQRARRSRTPRAAAGRSRSPGSEFVIDCDMVLVAIGQKQDNAFLGDTAAEPRPPRRAAPRPEPASTELPNVWAAGDYVINPTNFISSIGEGKRVADLIDQAAARRQAEGQGDGDHPRSDRVRLDAESAASPRASPSGV